MRKFKNKILLASVVTSLLLGVSYQNCGQIDQDADHSRSEMQSTGVETQAIINKSEKESHLTFVLNNGSKMNFDVPMKSKTYKIFLKDGRVIDYTVKTR